MPKVPIYLSEKDVPATAPYQQESGAVLAGPAATLQRGASQIEATALQAQRHYNAIEAEKKRQQQTSDALDIMYDATKQLEQSNTDLRLGKRDPVTGEMLDQPATSQDYLERHNANAKKIFDDSLAQAASPGVREAVQIGLLRELSHRSIQASHYATSLFVDEQKADLHRQYHDALQLGSTAETLIEGERYADMFRSRLDSSTSIIGAAEVERLRENFDKDWLRHQALRDIRAGAYDETKYAGKLDPGVLDALLVRNDSTVAAAQRALKFGLHQWSESVDRATVKLAADRQLTAQHLETFRDAFEPPRLQAFYKLLEEQQFGSHGGDPETITQLTALVANRTNLSINPESTLAMATRAFNEKRIGSDRFIPMSSELGAEINRRRTEGRQAANEEDARMREMRNKRFNELNQNLELVFKTKTQFQDIDFIGSTALGFAREEMATQAESTGGTKEAHEAYNEVIAKYIPFANERYASYMEVLKSQLEYKDGNALKAARGSISETKYQQQADIMQKIVTIRNQAQKLQQIGEIMKTKPISAKP